MSHICSGVTFPRLQGVLCDPEIGMTCLLGWWRSDFGVFLEDGKVFKWLDASGHGVDLVQSHPGKRPTFPADVTRNGHSFLHCYKGGVYNSNPSTHPLPGGNATFHAFAVASSTINEELTGSVIYCGSHQTLHRTGIIMDSSTHAIGSVAQCQCNEDDEVGAPDHATRSGVMWESNVPAILELSIDFDKWMYDISVFRNGALACRETVNEGETLDLMQSFGIGLNNAAQDVHGCFDVAEVMLFDCALTLAERRFYLNYFATRYNIQLYL